MYYSLILFYCFFVLSHYIFFRSFDLFIISVGEKRGFWLIPNAPLISAKNYFFPLFFCSTQQKPKLFSKNTNSSPIASIISMRSHFSPFFSAHLNRNKITPPKSHFTYAIKHNFSLLILSTLFLHAIASISEKSPKFPIRFE